MSRPSWNEYFMLIAKVVASRSTCNSRPTGAVIARDNHILATGYNGSMPGTWHCSDQKDVDGKPYCFRRVKGIMDIDKYNYCRSSHAEANAIAQAARKGISVEGATLYTTLAPCYVCMKLIATSGIAGVYYEHRYDSEDEERDFFWMKAASDAGLKVYQMLTVSPETCDVICRSMKEVTSVRRIGATE